MDPSTFPAPVSLFFSLPKLAQATFCIFLGFWLIYSYVAGRHHILCNKFKETPSAEHKAAIQQSGLFLTPLSLVIGASHYLFVILFILGAEPDILNAMNFFDGEVQEQQHAIEVLLQKISAGIMFYMILMVAADLLLRLHPKTETIDKGSSPDPNSPRPRGVVEAEAAIIAETINGPLESIKQVFNAIFGNLKTELDGARAELHAIKIQMDNLQNDVGANQQRPGTSQNQNGENRRKSPNTQRDNNGLIVEFPKNQ